MQNILKNNLFAYLLISIIAGLIFIPLIGNCPLFDWDEINFAECAREMIVSGNYSKVQLNYQPFWEKPPVFIWMQALCMQVFGINEFSARLPNAICGVVTLTTLFYLGKKYFTPKMGFYWCLLYGSTLLPHLYFRAGLIDPWFNYFIFVSIIHIAVTLNDYNSKTYFFNALISGLFLGIAVLTKGPAALLIVGLVILSYVLIKKQWRFFTSKVFYIFSFSTLLVSASWFIVLLINGHKDLIIEFLVYQKRLAETADSGHDGPFYYHVIVLLVGCFPASLFFINNYNNTQSLTPFQKHMRLILLLLFWVVLILFSIIKTKIVHYSSLCYFPLTFIAAQGLSNLNFSLKKYQKIIFWFISSVFFIGITAIATFAFYKELILQFINPSDKFTIANLNADVKWNGYECGVAFVFIIAMLLIYLGYKQQNEKKLITGMLSLISFLILVVNIFIPKVEQYSQHAVIEFYEQIKHKKCYVETQNFKSYAYLFYANRKPDDYTNEDQKKYINDFLNNVEKEGHSRITFYSTANIEWMKHGNIDRPTFVVCKLQNEPEIDVLGTFKKLYTKNGFTFYLRMPEKNKSLYH